MEMTGGEALARQLAAEGITLVFGVPGVQLDYALDGLALIPDQVSFFNTRHEQAASYMADGYARSTGEVGAFMVVPGPGLLNATAGLATAYACSSPVVCISGQVPSRAVGRGFGVLHEIPDQSDVLRKLTKWSGYASAPEQVPGLVREAFRQLCSGRPQPVAIEIPPDVLQARAAVRFPDPDGNTLPEAEPDRDLLDRAAALLRSAEWPVICVGGGAVAAEAAVPLRLVAEALEAPVVMSPNGRGALSDRHPLALTSLGGPKVLAGADVVLAVGTRFRTSGGGPVSTPPHTSVIHLNADPRDLGSADASALAIHGDASVGLASLLEHLHNGPRRPSRAAELDHLRRWCADQLAAFEPQMSWIRALRSAIPDDGVLVTELTQVGYVSRVGYPVYGPRTYIGPGYQGTLGYGFPTALGAKIGNPGRAVVSITGDGGFGFNLQELSTARKFGIGLVTVIFNDSAFGNVRRDQRDKFDSRFIGTELCNPNFVELAHAFGVGAERVSSPDRLAATLEDALAAGEPYLIEAPVGEMPNPWELLDRSWCS